jgi:hypothetical protein
MTTASGHFEAVSKLSFSPIFRLRSLSYAGTSCIETVFQRLKILLFLGSMDSPQGRGVIPGPTYRFPELLTRKFARLSNRLPSFPPKTYENTPKAHLDCGQCLS